MTRWIDGERIIDLGCYLGWNSGFYKIYSTAKHYVVGTDLDAGNLRKAKGWLDEVVLADVRQLPFRDKAFNNSLAIEVLEHLPGEDAVEMIAEGKRVSDGYLFLTTPNGWRGRGNERLLLEHELMEHKSSYTANDLRTLGAKKVRGIGWKGRPSLSRYLFASWWVPFYFPKLSANLMALF